MINKILFLIFFFIYFGFQIFSQIWGTYIDNGGIPSTPNYIQNFTNALVLIGIVGYFGEPVINYNDWYVYITLIITFVLSLVYCYTKRVLDTQSITDKSNNINSSKKTIMIIIIALYSFFAVVYFLAYVAGIDMSERKLIMWCIPLFAILYFSFYFFKKNSDYENKFVLPFFIYPFLLLTTGIQRSRTLTYLYVIFFVTTVSIWGFFGVEWFVGLKGISQGNLDVNKCKAYLGISDGDLVTPDTDGQVQSNKQNINYLYIAISLIFMSFVIAIIITFITLRN